MTNAKNGTFSKIPFAQPASELDFGVNELFYSNHNIKRGLRNSDGTGVVAGLTHICNVHGYVIDEYERVPTEGKLYIRGYDIEDIVAGSEREDRFGYEELAYLLLFGSLPTKDELSQFRSLLEEARELPNGFIEDMIMKAASPNVMNMLERNVLALYSYDNNADDYSLENTYRQCISVTAKLPLCMSAAYQVKRRVYDNQSFFIHYPISGLSSAENILSMMLPDRTFTHEEAILLDRCMMLHAEHGGGNNSTFAVRCLTSAGTDTYSALGAGIGSLKGFRHGGANIKVVQQTKQMKEAIKDLNDDEEIEAYLKKVMAKDAGDGTGLIYGMGHAVYTLSDPRARILKKEAAKLIEQKGYTEDFKLLDAVERIAPKLLAVRSVTSGAFSANVDLYSGLVYQMLGIPEELYTPLFAVARMAGWCAHRIEEMQTCRRIMRPAYRTMERIHEYKPINER